MVHPALSWVMVQLLGKGTPSNVRQRDLTRSLGPGDGGEGKELLQRLVSASHSYQDGADEKTSSEFEGANR